MKKIVLQLPLFLALGLVLTFNSCKKASPTTSADDSVSATDATIVNTAADNISNDASVASDQTSQISRSTNSGSAWTTICGATVDTSSGSIVITYDGSTSCSGFTRTGTVTITRASDSAWSQANSQVLIAINVTATVVGTGSKYTLTGNDTITNETGGLVYKVILGQSAGPVNRRYSGSMQITLPAGGARTWTYDRTISWTNANSIISTSLYSEAPGNVAVTGTDRYGREFTSVYNTPIADNDHLCTIGSFPAYIYAFPYAGKVTHTIGANRTVTVQYGTDASGAAVGGPGFCPSNFTSYGVYISYNNNKTGVAANLFLPYWW